MSPSWRFDYLSNLGLMTCNTCIEFILAVPTVC